MAQTTRRRAWILSSAGKCREMKNSAHYFDIPPDKHQSERFTQLEMSGKRCKPSAERNNGYRDRSPDMKGEKHSYHCDS